MTALAHPVRRRPTIRGLVHITLTRRLVDSTGYCRREAATEAWTQVAGLPSGASVTIDVGPARHADHRVLQTVLAVMDGGELRFSGDAVAVAEWIAAANSMSA